jgi:hypothetical protein
MLFGLTEPSARADTPPQIDPQRVRIGLPAGQETGRSRNGAWAPIAVVLKAGAQGNPQGVYRLRIETTDFEDLTYQYTVPVPALAGNGERTVMGYIVPGGDSATFKVQLETTAGKVVQTVAKLTRDGSKFEVINQSDVLFFAVGAGLSQLKRTNEKLDKPPEGKEEQVDPDEARRQHAYAEDVSLLPDRWIGYDAVDVVVLATGSRDFVNGLAQDSDPARRNALLEWVRRGGQLVISVGRNKQEVAQLLQKMPFIDCKVTGSEVVKRPLRTLSIDWCKREIHRPPLQGVDLATVVPGKGVHVMVRDDSRPILMEASYGLGRVILVAFDLDRAPFTTWDGQQAFWTRLQSEAAPYLPVREGRADRAAVAPPGRMRGMPGMQIEDERYDLRAVLKRELESFEEIPVIPFTWVALFILFYIVLVGPLDYFLLKKLFKRLELTWVTFPLTVIVVSVIAYAVAYASKGDDVRINKVDVVDIDLHQPRQVYGQTFFTLFSPRVQSYTIGIEPAGGEWTDTVPAGAPGPVVTLLEGGDRTPRTGAESLFPRPYRYADEAAGLLEVPIPVWATRSFTASWRAPVPAKAPPVGIDDEVGPVRRARNGEGLTGRLTNNLSVELRSATLFYREKWYNLGTLAPGESRRIESLFGRDAKDRNRTITEWFNDSSRLAPGIPIAPTGRPLNSRYANPRPVYEEIKRLLFYREYGVADKEMTNAGLRRMDQSWRLRTLPEYPVPTNARFRDEAILVARAPVMADRAEAVTENGISPSRLWIGAIPDTGADRPKVAGYVTQETYIRVFMPVEREP